MHSTFLAKKREINSFRVVNIVSFVFVMYAKSVQVVNKQDFGRRGRLHRDDCFSSLLYYYVILIVIAS